MSVSVNRSVSAYGGAVQSNFAPEPTRKPMIASPSKVRVTVRRPASKTAVATSWGYPWVVPCWTSVIAS